MIIDDDQEELRLLEKMLSGQENISIHLAAGGKEGLEEVHTNPPDAIILDLFMPDIDGFTLFEMLQSDPSLKGIPIIFLTGADLTPIQSQLLAEFGQKMLTKGMMKESDLLGSLEDALKRRKKQK